MNNSYTMAYGPDPDPYGAVPPYRVGYDTYDPNYPSIPGVANSFSPSSNEFTPTATTFQPSGNGFNNAPNVQPGATPTGNLADYSFYYDRSAAAAAAAAADDQQKRLISPTEAVSPYANYHTGMFYSYPTTFPPAPPTLHTPTRGNDANNNNRGAFAPSPWNTSGSPVNPAAAGLGRQAEIPLPIGTRPKSNAGLPFQQQKTY
jgi:hypothetical protein